MESQLESVKTSRVMSWVKDVINKYSWYIVLVAICIALTLYFRPLAIESRGGNLSPGGELSFLFIPFIVYGFSDSHKKLKEEWRK